MSTPRRLRVAVLQRRFGARFGGAERYAVEMVREMRTTHDIHVFAQMFEHDVQGITEHRIAMAMSRPRWLNQLWFAVLTWWHTRRGFEVVHSHENTWHGNVQSIHVRPFRLGLTRGRGPLGRALKRISIALSPRLLTYWTLESLRMRAVRGRAIVASSKSVHNEVADEWPHIRASMHVVDPGVRLPDVSDTPDAPDTKESVDRHALRINLGLSAPAVASPLALFVGNDPVKKGLPCLLQAMGIGDLEDLHLLVVTAPGQVKAAQALAAQARVASRTHVIGSLADITHAYRAADFLVHPTTEDTYAMVVLEAMAWSLPVIVSDAGHCGIAADLRDGIDALLLGDPHDSKALAGLIQQLMQEQALAQSLRNAGVAFAQARTWHRQARVLERIYERVA